MTETFKEWWDICYDTAVVIGLVILIALKLKHITIDLESRPYYGDRFGGIESGVNSLKTELINEMRGNRDKMDGLSRQVSELTGHIKGATT